MTNLPENLFSNPVWQALQTKHSHFAITAGDACRYPADVAPFAAVAASSTIALQQLASLLAPGESVWIFDEDRPSATELNVIETLKCLQMVLPDEVTPPDPTVDLVRLSADDAPEMVALTTLAFPDFFAAGPTRWGPITGCDSMVN